ncbi:helix-turn-helix transcriptional regulator [Streptomyces sp. Edi4]|uniref:helix-turn-helix domain-containing protein n=1 Tax=Streptomyces sp. Edi4 TaxID=3162527 RepID=UPI003305E28B
MSARPAGQFIGFGAMLKRWRKAAGVTQPRAARTLGISERKLRGIESGAYSGPHSARAERKAPDRQKTRSGAYF